MVSVELYRMRVMEWHGRVTGPWVRSTSATTQHITMADKVKTNNPQGLIDEGNPTLREMAQNTNPTMQMLAGILQTQIRLLQGIAQSGVEAWLKLIHKILDAISCTYEQRVVFATFFLQGEVDHWWEVKACLLRTPITRKMFVDAFYEKCFPRSVANQMERQFLDLIQENKTVAEYEDKFNTLSRFALSLVDTEEKRCRHFLEGLRPFIRDPLEDFRITDCADLVDRATNKEMRLNESQKRRDRQNQQSRHRGSQNKDGPSFQKNFPPYTLCGRLHRGECYMKIGACFGYGQTSHIVKGCLKRHNNAISTQAEESPRKKPRVQGRVFAMTKQDAEASNDVVIGTLSLFSRDAKVLFDSGATHSFMSIAFACRANRNTEPLGGLICVLKANKMLTKGCEGFLAYLITDNNSEISLGDIQVVKEISDVFPEKLPDLSSD
ncbi:hypothetical protein WN943_003066 [Citrus x changshan-huyou]